MKRIIEYVWQTMPWQAWAMLAIVVLIAVVLVLVFHRANTKADRVIRQNQREQAILRIAGLYKQDCDWVRRQITALMHDKAVSEDQAIIEMLDIVN